MEDAQKIARYDRIEQIVKDQIALEKHMCEHQEPFDEITFIRCDAYGHIIDVLIREAGLMPRFGSLDA